MKKFKKVWLLVIIFLAVFSFCMLVVFDIQGAEPQQVSNLDGGGRLGFGYIQESDVAIVDFDVAIYINPEKRFRGSVFVGMETLVESPDVVCSELPYLVQYTIGGTLNYSVLYVLAQGYYAFIVDSDFGYQIKLAVGVSCNMPYRTFNTNPLFDAGFDFSFGYLPNLDSYFTALGLALYIRPDKLINGVIFGGAETLMERAKRYGGSNLSFCPYQDRYSFGVALNIKMFSLRWEHYCIHPVWSTQDQFSDKFYGENSTKFSIGIQHKFPFKVKRIGW